VGNGSLVSGVILGTAGHIDHGKTALVHALTGVDTDRLPEEKRRGITIDLGFAPLEVNGRTIGIVDVPGHEAFIKTMLAGASGIDMAMLVIAADEGVMPQTREHLEILSLLGVTKGVVALTKSDLVDDEWLALQVEEIAALVGATTFNPIDIIAVSAKTGSGIAALKNAIESVAATVEVPRLTRDLFRMPIDRAFSVKGTGTVVTGTVWSGEIRKDSAVIVRPGSRTARVRAIQHHGHAAELARAGERSALALAGVELEEVGRGSVLVSNDEWVATREIDAMVQLNHADLQISPRSRIGFHLGTSETTVRLVSSRVVSSEREKRVFRARIHFAEPVLVRGRDRFVLRLPSPARTIGGGVVLDSSPEPRKRGARRNAEEVDKDGSLSPQGICESIIGAAGAAGLPVEALAVRTGLSPQEVQAWLSGATVEVIEARVFSSQAIDELSTRIEAIVKRQTANHSLDSGVSLQSIRSSVKGADEVIELVLDRLVSSQKIERTGSIVRPANWKPELDARDKATSEAILHEICKQPSEPPSVGELSARFGGKTVALLRKLERDGQLERVSDDRYYSRPALALIVEKLRSSLERGRVYAPAELREVLGVSRKYLIPFLEFCDRSGVTERRPEGRSLR
jgi:selenocysteine-specific elongation factor